MILSKENNTLVLRLDEENIRDSKTFCSEYTKEVERLDVVLDVLQIPNLNAYKKALALVLTTFQNEDNTCVTVALPKQYDDLPEAWIFVPTLEEAHDFIELVRIQHDLGF
tara:strand:- start:1749 stop:2078 length:330 start_codon:yes stop_codon:yes gene_type:complete